MEEGFAPGVPTTAVKASHSLIAGTATVLAGAVSLGVLTAAVAGFMGVLGVPATLALAAVAYFNLVSSVGFFSQAWRAARIAKRVTGDWKAPVATPYGEIPPSVTGLWRESVEKHEAVHRAQIAVGKDGELMPYAKQGFDFATRVWLKAAIAAVASVVSTFNAALNKAKEAIEGIGALAVAVDFANLPEALKASVKDMLEVKEVELMLAGNAAVDIAVFKATRVAPSTLYKVDESIFSMDDNVKIIKTEEGKLKLQVQNGGREDFEGKQLSLTESVKNTFETGDMAERIETLAKVLAEWARYNATGFDFEGASQNTVVQALFSITTAIEARTNIRQLESSIDELVGADNEARSKITAFIHPERGVEAVRREAAVRAKEDLARMRELAEHFARPAAPKVPVAPAVPAAVVPPTVEPIVLAPSEERLPLAVSPEHTRMIVQLMQSQKVDIQALSDKTALPMQELCLAVTKAMEKMGSYNRPIVSGFDLRSGRLDDSKVIDQINAEVNEFGGDTVRHVIVVDTESEVRVRAELGKNAENVQIIVYDSEKHTTIVDAFNDGIAQIEVTRNITVDRSFVALALTESDAPAVKEYYRAERAAGRTNVFNYLVVNPEDEHVKLAEQGDMLPTLNLVSILTRLAVKTQPTVMTVACSEATIMDLERALAGMLNFVRITAQNISGQVREFIDSIGKVAVAL
jgi:hypothetical protein